MKPKLTPSPAALAVPVTMSSLEIAELTHKNHADVMRDVRKIFSEVEIDQSKFADIFLDSYQREQPCFRLPRRECDLIIAGYSARYRLAIIDRWQELESRQQLAMPNFNNPAEAARAWALQFEQAQNAIQTKAEIGSRREATAMNTASQAVKKANQLERELDRSKQYCTIKRMEMLCHGQKFSWRPLKAAGIEMGIAAIEVFDANYGSVLSYHSSVWKEAYALDLSELAGGAE